MKLAYIRWRDAVADEADNEPLGEQRLAELHEVGFYLGETADAVSIAMEHQEGAVHPGRWRLHVPKSQIVEMHVVEFKRAFAKPRAPRKAKVKIVIQETSHEADICTSR
jgi:hypothetical protein